MNILASSLKFANKIPNKSIPTNSYYKKGGIKLKSYNLDTCQNFPDYKIKLLPPFKQSKISNVPYHANTININIINININNMNASASLNIGKDFVSIPLSEQQITHGGTTPGVSTGVTAGIPTGITPETPTEITPGSPPGPIQEETPPGPIQDLPPPGPAPGPPPGPPPGRA
jgi:hypothetical protein